MSSSFFSGCVVGLYELGCDCIRICSGVVAERVDEAPVAFIGFADSDSGHSHADGWVGFAHGLGLGAEAAAGIRFAVKVLGYGCGAAGLRGVEDFDGKETAFVGDLEGIADPDFAGGFGGGGI